MDGSGSTRARVLAFLLAGLVGVAVAQSVYNIPIQVSDSLDVIMDSRQPPSSWAMFGQPGLAGIGHDVSAGALPAARWLGGLADASGWSDHAVFRGLHALLAFAVVALFAWVARVRTATDVGALGIALTVLIGHHTFSGMLREAYPVNHYADCLGSLLILGIAQRRRGPGAVLVLAILAAGLLVIESAVLLWVILVACVAIGLPGLPEDRGRRHRHVGRVSRGELLLGISAPGIGSHGSGWLATMYSADELVARFGSNPWPFYAYNVAGGALSVVASEPRFGVYGLSGPGRGRPCSSCTWRRLWSSASSSWIRPRLLGRPVSSWAPETRMVGLCGVLAVSALLCATYIKDEIVSTAGVFYALAAYVAIRWLFDSRARPRARRSSPPAS